MILLLDTSTPACRVALVEGDARTAHEWLANRELATGLLGYLENTLAEAGKAWADLAGFVVYQGPGSFTGLRICITVLNTMAYSLSVPIVGTTGKDWEKVGLTRLAAGENDAIVLPEYGGEANITTPRK